MFSYLSNNIVFVPEIEITVLKETYKCELLRGYGYVMAVFDGDECIGYCAKLT